MKITEKTKRALAMSVFVIGYALAGVVAALLFIFSVTIKFGWEVGRHWYLQLMERFRGWIGV